MTSTIHIKNMVCARCTRSVEQILRGLGYPVLEVALGWASVDGAITDLPALRAALQRDGFDLVDDRKAQLVESIKALIIDLVHVRGLTSIPTNLSSYVASELGKDYHYLSTLFSQLENVTIEKYVILQKLERAKELLIYDELTLTQIAQILGYSSVAYLSAQFKEQTGFTPTEFKKLKSHTSEPGAMRKGLDDVA